MTGLGAAPFTNVKHIFYRFEPTGVVLLCDKLTLHIVSSCCKLSELLEWERKQRTEAQAKATAIEDEFHAFRLAAAEEQQKLRAAADAVAAESDLERAVAAERAALEVKKDKQQKKMEELQLFRGDTVLLKGKKGKQTVCTCH